jgi:hypothetical protein
MLAVPLNVEMWEIRQWFMFAQRSRMNCVSFGVRHAYFEAVCQNYFQHANN